jgi:hypothetical protein
MKMEQIECSEMFAYKIQTPGNHPEENIQILTYSKKFTVKIYRLNQNLQLLIRYL